METTTKDLLERLMAISLDGEFLLKRFPTEAVAAGLLTHPWCCTVQEGGNYIYGNSPEEAVANAEAAYAHDHSVQESPGTEE